MRTLTSLLAAVILIVCAAAPGHADSIQVFSTDSTDAEGSTKCLSGSTFSVELADLSVGGVSFDAVLTVTGSSTLTQTSSGLGVSGGGGNLLNDGESLTFSLAIDNVSGGSVVFGGFTSLDFTFFTTSGEQGVFSIDGSLTTTSDNFLTHTSSGTGTSDPDISSSLPTAFTLFGKDGTDDDGNTVSTSFRLDSIEGTFSTAAPVPEPGTLTLVGLAGLAAGVGARRRRRRACVETDAAGRRRTRDG